VAVLALLSAGVVKMAVLELLSATAEALAERQLSVAPLCDVSDQPLPPVPPPPIAATTACRTNPNALTSTSLSASTSCPLAELSGLVEP